MKLGYDIGLSAIRAHQVRIATHGNNIANANTPGYARQVVDLTETPQFEYHNLLLGTGVKASAVRSLRDAATDSGLSRNAALTGSVEAQLDAARNIETLLTPSDSSIHATLSDVFNNLERVANNPEDATARGEFVSSAASLVEQGAFISESLTEIKQGAARDHAHGVEQVNALVRQVAAINRDIAAAGALNEVPSALLGQRDEAISKLTEWIDVTVSPSEEGADVVLLGGGSVLFTVNPVTLTSEVTDDGKLSIQVDPGREVNVDGGKLDGLQQVHNSTIEEAREELQGLISEVVRQIDQLHASGLSSPDGFQALTGTRGPLRSDVSLADAGLAFPVTEGEIFVTVTDQATGARSTQAIEVIPEWESLQDFADKISGIDNLEAVITPGSNQLVVRGAEGFTFDFAGRPDNVADNASFTGTSQISFSGAYSPNPPAERWFDPQNPAASGDPNERLTISLPTSGQIGVTDGLLAEVRDSSGALLQTIPVGPEYAVGSAVSLNNGISVSFGGGTVVANDEVSVDAVQHADTSGLLSALGMNGFFTGNSVGTYQVRSDIQENPFQFSAGLTGEFGDAANAAYMASLRDHRFDNLGGQTFVESLADLTALAGLDVQELEKDLNRLETYGNQLQAARDELSGVNLNEELLELMSAERSFQAAAKFIATYDEIVVELLGLVR